MKKTVKKLMVVVFAVMMALVPIASASAESRLVLVDRTADYVRYAYQPDPYYLHSGTGIALINDYVADDLYHVAPYASFSFGFDLKYYSTVHITVQDMNTYQVVYSQQFTGYGGGATFGNNLPSEAAYKIVIVGITDAYIDSYWATN